MGWGGVDRFPKAQTCFRRHVPRLVPRSWVAEEHTLDVRLCNRHVVGTDYQNLRYEVLPKNIAKENVFAASSKLDSCSGSVDLWNSCLFYCTGIGNQMNKNCSTRKRNHIGGEPITARPIKVTLQRVQSLPGYLAAK
jgi:hypothetical protein